MNEKINSNFRRRRRQNVGIKNNEKRNKKSSLVKKVFENLKVIKKYILLLILVVLIFIGAKALLFNVNNTPKSEVKSFLKEYKKNSFAAKIKYSITDFQNFLDKEQKRFLTYKILSEKKVLDKPETYEIDVEFTNVSSEGITSEVNRNLSSRKISVDDNNYFSEFKKEYRKINSQRKKSGKTFNINKKIKVIKDNITKNYIIDNAGDLD